MQIGRRASDGVHAGTGRHASSGLCLRRLSTSAIHWLHLAPLAACRRTSTLTSWQASTESLSPLFRAGFSLRVSPSHPPTRHRCAVPSGHRQKRNPFKYHHNPPEPNGIPAGRPLPPQGEPPLMFCSPPLNCRRPWSPAESRTPPPANRVPRPRRPFKGCHPPSGRFMLPPLGSS